MRNKIVVRINPNLEVEKWKDKIYKEIKNIPSKNLSDYFEKKAEKILKNYEIIK